MLQIQDVDREEGLAPVRIEEIKKIGKRVLFRPIDQTYFVAWVIIPLDAICDDGHTDVLIDEVVGHWSSKKYGVGKRVRVRRADLEEVSD